MGSSKENTSQIIGDKIATLFGLTESITDPNKLLKEIGLASSRVYNHVPGQCFICKHDKFSNLSLLGVYRKPVFYECEECGALHLRYEKGWIVDKMKKLKNVYINPEDWKDEPPKSEYN
jgi:hypothetical protein